MEGNFKPASLKRYVEWLTGFVNQGGRPTHRYRYRFQRVAEKFLYVGGWFRLDGEVGAESCNIVVAPCSTPDPASCLGHNSLFFVEGFTTRGIVVPVYDDPVFEGIPGLGEVMADMKYTVYRVIRPNTYPA